jgi:hypothetical protein
MDKFCLTYFIFWLLPFFGWSQELIWEKQIPLSTYESFSCISKTSNGEYIALGYSKKWKVNLPNTTLLGAILIKFDSNGDTLWTKWTGYYGGFNKVVRGDNGLFYGLMAYQDMATNSNKWGIYVFNEDGISLGIIPIQTAGSVTLLDMEFRHGYLWISGQKTPSLIYPSITGAFDFLLMKLRPDGTEVFSFVYNAGEPASRGRMMEFMPNGHILFSGSCGRNLSAFEIDTAGNQISFRNYFQNPLNGGWQNARVQQMADGNLLVSGYRSTTPRSFYIGSHDTSNVVHWGGISRGALTAITTHTDSSTVMVISNQTDGDRMVKVGSDSTIEWEINFSQTPLGGFKGIDDFVYEPDGSVVMGGYYKPTSNGFQNLYMARFSGFGILFEPTSAKTLVHQKAEVHPISYPNPGNNNLWFTMLEGPAKVHIADMQGRKVWDGAYLPGKGINTQSFRPGIYNYRLEQHGKILMGKWVKLAP